MSTERYIVERLVHNRMKKSHKLFESSEKAPRSYYKKVEYILNHRLGSYETGVSVENIDIISETPGTITLKVDYEVDIQIPIVDPEDKRTYYETDSEYRSQTMTFDFDELDESVSDRTLKRISYTTEFDNGHVLHNDWRRVSIEDAEELARQRSLEEPNKIFYVQYDDIMDPSSDNYYKNGKLCDYKGNYLKEDLTPNHPADGPRIGSKVRILRGGYRGQIGKVVDIDFDEEEGDQYSVETPDKSIRYLDDTDIELIKEDLTLDDDPEETDQQYSSAATSINSSKLPALFSMVDFKEGSINLDYGGGRFDNVAEYLQDKYGATNLVYDKYNRSADHNREVLNQIRQSGGADTVTCSNVLNVIAEESERLAVLRNCKRYLKSGGTCYITVYEGNGKGEGAPTKSGYQLNRKTKDYEDEIKKVFSSVTRKGKLFICR